MARNRNARSKKQRVVKGNVKNSKNNISNISNPSNPRTDSKLKFDFSFEGLYYSVKGANNKFNNYLANEHEFIEKFRQIRKVNAKLTGKQFDKVKHDANIHCHKLDEKEANIARSCIGAAISKYNTGFDVSTGINQLIGDEKLYQIGLNAGVRIIGTYNFANGIFRAYLIDYNHSLYPDERRNKHSKKELKFCPMNGIQ